MLVMEICHAYGQYLNLIKMDLFDVGTVLTFPWSREWKLVLESDPVKRINNQLYNLLVTGATGVSMELNLLESQTRLQHISW